MPNEMTSAHGGSEGCEPDEWGGFDLEPRLPWPDPESVAGVREEADGWREAAGQSANRWNDAIVRLSAAEAERDDLRATVARVEALAECIAYEHAAAIDGEYGCCHDKAALRAGGRVPYFDGDEFDPVPDDCLGKRTADHHLAAIAAAALATPPTVQREAEVRP